MERTLFSSFGLYSCPLPESLTQTFWQRAFAFKVRSSQNLRGSCPSKGGRCQGTNGNPSYLFSTENGLLLQMRITRKSGHFLPKVWPRKKKPASPPCKPVYVPGRGKADTCARSVVFVTRMALQANLPMWPNFR